jgi:allantoate deiminase
MAGAADIGMEPLSMVSGAGHDAMILAGRVPTTMIFLRSPGGISHHPEESVRPQDVQNALAAGRAFFRLMTKIISKEQSV